MDKGLEALAGLPEDVGLVPEPTGKLTAVCNSISRRSNVLFWPQWALTTCSTQIEHTGKTSILIK